MDFLEIAKLRQSCRSYDEARPVEEEKILAVLEAARLAPSACNGQPYHFTVCRGRAAREVAAATMGRGMNKFAVQAPVMIIVSEEPYVKSAALGAKVKNNDYRSMDIGIAAAHLTAQAACLELGTCILGWFDDERIRTICGLEHPVRLVITLGYPSSGDVLREKRRKAMEEIASFVSGTEDVPDDLHIERAKPEDASEVFALYHSLIGMPQGTWSEEYPDRELVEEDVAREKTLVMRDGASRIVAAIAVLDSEDEPEFDDAAPWYPDVKKWSVPARLGVAADMQGRGLAKAMLAASIDAARADGCDGVRFLVAKKNKIAQRAYASFGFDVCGECEMWGDVWLCYQKRL